MYVTYIVQRTQIYLTEQQGRLLRNRSQATGRTVSELIRDAVDGAYLPRSSPTVADKVLLARRTAGAWRDFPETGAEFVERVRGSGRLSRLARR